MKRKLLFITLLMLFCSTMFGQQHWQMTEADIVNYNLTMTVYADVTFNTDPLGDLDETKYEIAAFHNGVLRGVATPTYSEKLKRYTFRLIVHSKEIGQTISFKFFNPKEGPEGTVYNTDYTVNFSNGTVGMSLRPINIDFYEPYFDFDAPSSVENYMGFGCAVKIDGVEQNRPNLEIAAFKENGEVCGYARSQALVGTNIYIFSLPIYAQNGETISSFINCVAWRKQAENISKYCTKGTQVAVEGRIQVRNYDDQNGQKRYATEVIAEEAYFADSKRDGDASGFENTFGATMANNTEFQVDSSDDDLPF